MGDNDVAHFFVNFLNSYSNILDIILSIIVKIWLSTPLNKSLPALRLEASVIRISNYCRFTDTDEQLND